jgi:glycosyltransferase involved in cell wall biosynthesis
MKAEDADQTALPSTRVGGVPPDTVPSQAASAEGVAARPRPVVGMLWGDFPWAAPTRPLGGLLSAGIVARTLTHALTQVSLVRPYHSPPRTAAPAARQEMLAAFLRSIDVLWADCAAGSWSGRALAVRHELHLPCRAVIYMGGALPHGAELLLSAWQELLRPDDALLFTCHADHAIWQRLVHVSALQEWVIPLAADDTLFFPRAAQERAATRRCLGLPADAPLLLYVGRLNVQKNLHTLLRLFVAVREQVPEAHLCLVGEEDDASLEEFGVRNTGYGAWLRHRVETLGVSEAVTFVPSLVGTDLAQLYSAADVLVHPGIFHEENFGLVLAEAQLSALPVVCTAWGGFKDVVRPAETGYCMDAVLTKQGVRVDWAAGARQAVVLLRDPVRRAHMGRQAAAWARQQFSIAALVERLRLVLATTGTSPARAGRPRDRAMGAGAAAQLAPGVRADAPNAGSAAKPSAVVPSALARRYAARKRACGWDATAEKRAARWYPRLFEGNAYMLYEQLLGPYATRLASSGRGPATIQPEWVPYIVTDVARDPIRRLVYGLDPIWPYARYLTPWEWAVFTNVDGHTAVHEMATRLQGEYRGEEAGAADVWAALAQVLWHLQVDGFILFDRGDEVLGNTSTST